MPAPVARAKLELLFSRFISGDPKVEVEFHCIARPHLRKLAHRFGRFLAPDLREEIVQQAFLHLVGPAGQKFDPTRGSAASFLWLITQRATREVAAMYTSPGRQTRPPKRNMSETATDSMANLVSYKHAEEQEAPEVHEPPAVYDTTQIVEARCDVAAILAAAPVNVASALSRIYLEEVPMSVVAAEMGTNRFALARAIDKFAGTFTV